MKLKLFLLVLPFLAFASCMSRNKKVFEEFTDVSIPNGVKITNDEYQDMGQDYGRTLEIQLDNQSKRDLESSIFQSKCFNRYIFIVGNTIEETQMINIRGTRGLWYRTKTGYSFFGQTTDRRDNVTATIDTIKMNAEFQYASD